MHNCLYYALDKLHDEGGYIMFAGSTHWCMLHVLHLDATQTVLTHFVPPADLKYPWYALFGFVGEIQTEDLHMRKPVPMLCMFFSTVALVLMGARWSVSRWIRNMVSRRTK